MDPIRRYEYQQRRSRDAHLQYHGGLPANDPTWTGSSGVRCQAVADWKSYTQDFYHNFNTAAFAYPSGGTAAAPVINFGNTGPGILRQPGWWNQDLTLAKEFKLWTNDRAPIVMINIQAYNVLNHTEWKSIGTAFSFTAAGVNTNATTGQYTSTNNARQVAITARLQF